MSRKITIALAALGAALSAGIIVYLLLIVVDGAPVQAFRNVSRAMEPTLLAGDRFTISQGSVGVPCRGQLIAHVWPPDRSKKFVKRIVGLPGDTLAMRDGILFVDGRQTSEPYAWHEEPDVDPVSDDFLWQRAFLVGSASSDTVHYNASRNNWGPIVIPPGDYFVLGDNRDNSLDSRYWGFLREDDILGEVRRIYFSRDSTGHVLWSRFGRHPQ